MAHHPLAAALACLVVASCSAPSQPAPDGEPIASAAQAVEACPPSNTVLGIDISGYQHPNGAAIDWGQVAASRRFVIIKASEGTGYTNSYYADDAAQARAHGMIVGAYHFLLFNHDGAAQADQFLASVGGNIASGDLPAMLDVEDVNHSAAPGDRVAIMQAWLDRVEQVTGRKPMIYSGSWYWGPYMGNPGGYAGVYPMVWAAYVNGCPKVPDGFPGLTMWQYLGGEGSTPGIPAACDQDMFYGTEAELLALAQACKPHCEGTVIADANCGKGDCAAYGAKCVDDNLGVRCSFYACPDQGEADVCVDDKTLGHCNNGAITTGDCSAFGAYCSTAGSKPGHCASVFCVGSATEVPKEHDVCLPDGKRAHCDANGGIAASDCPANTVCLQGPNGAVCGGKNPPTGRLDAVDCDSARGWAQDADEKPKSINVTMSYGAAAGDKAAIPLTVLADENSTGFCKEIGECNHAFDAMLPLSLFDGASHPVHAYGVDSQGGPNAELSASPASMKCRATVPSGLRRHVKNPDSYAKWGFSDAFDRLPLTDAQIAQVKEGLEAPDGPTLVKADDGSAEVWLIDGASRRHVPDMQAFTAWRFSWGKVGTMAAAKVAAFVRGPDVPPRPVLVRSTNGAVYMLDLAEGQDASSWPGAGGRQGRATSKPIGFPGSSDDSGCSVATAASSSHSHGWMLLMLAAAWVARRRRAR